MAIPKYDQLMLPLLKFLKQHREPTRIAEATKALAIESRLSEEELNQTLPSGSYIFAGRVGWAKTYLVKAGLVSQPKRGYCELTEQGRALDLSLLNQINNDYLMQFEGFSQFKNSMKITKPFNRPLAKVC